MKIKKDFIQIFLNKKGGNGSLKWNKSTENWENSEKNLIYYFLTIQCWHFYSSRIHFDYSDRHHLCTELSFLYFLLHFRFERTIWLHCLLPLYPKAKLTNWECNRTFESFFCIWSISSDFSSLNYFNKFSLRFK